MIKKYILLIMLFAVEVSIASGITPQISNFRIEVNQPNRIYFDSSVPIVGSDVEGFDLKDKGGIAFVGVFLNSGQLSGHYFTVSSNFKWYHNNTLNYNGGSDIQSEVGVTLSKFDLQYIKNNIPIPEFSGKEYYVTTSGNDNNDGLTEGTAFLTIQRAIKFAKAGDKVWIKAGNYRGENLNIKHSGNVNNPIIFEGYKSSPGDISSLYYSYGSGKLDADEMPLLDGGDRASGIAIKFNNEKSYIIIRNIQITNYRVGVKGFEGQKAIVLERLIVKNIGTNNIEGHGIEFNTFNNNNNYNRFLNCIVINSSHNNFSFSGDNNLSEGCESYCDEVDMGNELGLTTDYYYYMKGNFNVVRNSLADKHLVYGHNGHAFGTKYASKYNLVEFCESINIIDSFMARHADAKYNVFRNSEAHADVSYKSRGWTGGISLLSGGSYNVWDKIFIHNVVYGFYLVKNSEDYSNTEIGHDNIFKNIILSDIEVGMRIRNTISRTAYFNDNKFYNITWNEIGTLFEIHGTKGGVNMSGNEFKNNIFSNVYKFYNRGGNYEVPSGFTWSNNNFYNSWDVKGTNAINVNPKFVDLASNDFRLQSESECIDAGIALNEVLFDFDNVSRDQGKGYDLGAFEFQSLDSQDVSLGEDIEICSGSSVSLVASGVGDFLWNTGETTQSIAVSPTETTEYSVTLTNVSGTVSSDSINVVVLELPTANAGEDVIICSGLETILTASGGDSYLWSTGETTQSITVNPIETTVYTVTTANDGCSNTAEGQVTVSVEAAINLSVSNDLEICNGETVMLTAEGADNYLWNTGETTASITVNPSETTTYEVSSSNGECTISKEVIVTVNEVPTVNAGDDVLICNGENIELTATGTGNFIWSTGETTSSIIVSPSSTTTYTVSSSSPCGTQVSDDVIVTVNDIPTLNIGEDLEICEGDTILLTATGADNYEWSTGETTASISVNPVITTTYTVSSSNGKCIISEELTVTVNKKLTVDAGNDISICEGDEVILTASGNGVFVWSTGETKTSIIVSPTTTTTYTVSSSDSCGEVIDEVTVFVNSLPSINAGNDVTIAGGETVTLTATDSGNYLWSTGETTQSITVNPRLTTTYSVSVTSSEGCRNIDYVVVNVENEEVVANAGEDVEICRDSNITLFASGGDDFLWSTGETTQSIVVSPNETTTYSVTVSNVTSLDTDEVVVTVDQTCSGIANRSVEKQTILYPNPTNGILNLRMSGYSETIKITIINMRGSILFSQIITSSSFTKKLNRKLDLSGFSKGMYFVRVENKQNVQTQKVILY